jgi:hypothetical protein
MVIVPSVKDQGAVENQEQEVLDVVEEVVDVLDVLVASSVAPLVSV